MYSAFIGSVLKTLSLKVLANMGDMTWTITPLVICAIVEINVVIICGSAPTLRPLFRRPRANSPSPSQEKPSNPIRKWPSTPDLWSEATLGTRLTSTTAILSALDGQEISVADEGKGWILDALQRVGSQRTTWVRRTMSVSVELHSGEESEIGILPREVDRVDGGND